MERFMRQHSVMNGLSSACPLPLLINSNAIQLHDALISVGEFL